MNPNELVDDIKDFPTLPTIYTKLLEVIGNPRSSVTDVSKVIESDQAASLRVLKTVNSSVFALQSRVDNISQAIFHIGFNEVKNLVLALSMVNIFGLKQSTSTFNIIDLWKHSIAVGIISRHLGKLIGIKNVENYFISGIVHDIGKLFYFLVDPDKYAEVVAYANNNGVTINDAENEILSFPHDIIGEAVALKWKIPVTIRHAIRYHHTGFTDGKIDLLVACVHLADIIAQSMSLGNSGDAFIHEPNYDVWDVLKIPPKTFVNMMPKIQEDFDNATSILLVR